MEEVQQQGKQKQNLSAALAAHRASEISAFSAFHENPFVAIVACCLEGGDYGTSAAA